MSNDFWITAKDPRRQLLGAQAREKGKLFEERVELGLRYYRQAGFADVDKTPEPMKIIRSLGKGQFIACFEKKAQPDYKGVQTGGQEILMEAKYTDSQRITLDRVGDLQAEYLTRHQKLGALCFVICGYGSGKVYRIPWETFRTMKARFGRKYITEADIRRYEIEQLPNGILLLLA